MAARAPIWLPPLRASDAVSLSEELLREVRISESNATAVLELRSGSSAGTNVLEGHWEGSVLCRCAPEDAVSMHPERMRILQVASGDCIGVSNLLPSSQRSTTRPMLAFAVPNAALGKDEAWMTHALAFQLGIRSDLDALTSSGGEREGMRIKVKRVARPRKAKRASLARVAAPSAPRLAAAMPRSPPDPLMEESRESAMRRAALDIAERGEAAHAARHAERVVQDATKAWRHAWRNGDVVHVTSKPRSVAERLAVPCIRDINGVGGPFGMHFLVRTLEAFPGEGEDDVDGMLVDDRTALVVRGQARNAVPGYIQTPQATVPGSKEKFHEQRDVQKQHPRLTGDLDAHGLSPCAMILASLWAPCIGPSAASKRRAPATLISGGLGSRQSAHARAAARRVGARFVSLDARELAASPGAEDATAAAADRLAAAFESANAFSPAVLCLTNVDALAPSAAAAAGGGGSGQAGAGPTKARAGAWLARSLASLARGHIDVFLVGTCKDPAGLPPPLRRVFSHEVRAGGSHGGGEKQTQARLQAVRSFLPWMAEEEAQKVAESAAGLDDASLCSVAAKIAGRCATVERARGRGGWNNEDLAQWTVLAVQEVRARAGAGAAAVRVPRIEWADIGGLEKAKASLRETFELPRQAPALFMGGSASGGRALRRRRGVLLWGPPGTGKTMLAKALAHEGGMSFLAVKGPELLDAYIGESERKVREVFAKARDAAPAVIFFDELDALAPARGGAGGAGGGATDRVVAQLLAELDGVADSSASRGGSAPPQVFVVGATNRPDLIDAALLRPGRFDKKVFVGIAEQAEGRAKVLHALTRKFALADDVDILEVARKCPERFTGADLYGVAADAWLRAMKRAAAAQAKGLDKVRGLGGLGLHPDGNKHPAGSVVVRQQDLVGALHGRSPSVSAAEYQRYITLAKQYEPDMDAADSS